MSASSDLLQFAKERAIRDHSRAGALMRILKYIFVFLFAFFSLENGAKATVQDTYRS